MNDARDARLLLAILEHRWDDAKALVGSAPFDAERFIALCRSCDVPTWVHAELVRSERGDLVGDTVVEKLGDLRKKIQRDNLLLLARTEQALGALARAGIRPIGLKGIDLLHRFYRFDERTLTDVDLLLRREDLEQGLSAFESEGWTTYPEPRRTHYIRSSHHLPLEGPGPVPVEIELHWNLAQEDRFQVDPNGLFERAEPLKIGETELLRMNSNDMAAHLLLHHFTHYFDRGLKWAVDLKALAATPGFDWGGVVERLREWGATVASGMAVLHLRKCFPGWFPERLERDLPVSAWRRIATLPLRSRHPLDLFRGTRRRWVQLYLAAVLLERPGQLPGWLLHRRTRGSTVGENPLDPEHG
jgi:hypothetical protein